MGQTPHLLLHRESDVLVRRSGIYHYRRVVPPRLRSILGAREIWLSLKTPYVRVAESRVARFNAEIDGVIMSARDNLSLGSHPSSQVRDVARELRDVLSKAKALASVTGRLQRYTETIGPELYVDTRVKPRSFGSEDIFDIVNRLQERLKVVDDISVRLEAVEASAGKAQQRTTPPASPAMSVNQR
ncbi:DUF6538 domain-containing protein [Acidisoma cladoniae]|uniref:DUF6538 domain-containing protein n=1 Tax=Acidisoma cladoniae TaxID=3040935 RepID=UPI0033132F44